MKTILVTQYKLEDDEDVAVIIKRDRTSVLVRAGGLDDVQVVDILYKIINQIREGWT
jgi:hypothetical protein